MKNRFLKKVILGLLVATSGFFGACSDDDAQRALPNANGFFIVNEGGFGNGDASLSYFERTNNKVINNIFLDLAGKPLGDQAQSMTAYNGNGYIVVQNSAKLEVLDLATYQIVATIGTDQGIVSPRYFVGLNENKGYVSDWGDGFTGTVKVLDLNTMEVTKSISTGSGANQMVLKGNKLYVANNGGYGNDNTVVVINTDTDLVTTRIIVGDNPSSLAVDNEMNVWVTGNGQPAYNDDWSVDEANSTPGFIAKINASDEVVLKLEATEISSGPGSVNINPTGTELYFKYSGALYKMSVTATELPSESFINKSFYGLGVDPVTGNIFGGEAPNYSSAGTVYQYSASGELIDQYTSGIAPSGFAFR